MVNDYRNRNTIVTKVQCGAYRSIIQVNGGRWFVFGYNEFGQLGIGNTHHQETPIELPLPNCVGNNKENQFINIFCGNDHNIGITENGDCYGWGYNIKGQLGLNAKGQLGLDNFENYSTPTKLKEAPLSTTENQVQQRYIWFSCGEDHTVALTNLGIFVLTVNQTIQFMM